MQERLLAENVLFVANRSFEVYLHQRYSYDEIERGMRVPFFGNRRLLRAEERDEAGNQYDSAGTRRHPLSKTVCLARRNRPARNGQSAAREGKFRARVLPGVVAAGIRRRRPAPDRRRSACGRGLPGAVIEEYALGPAVNLNFFYSPLLGELELLGTDTRRQTNLEGFRNLPPSAFDAVRGVPMRLEEAGHVAATLTESMLEQAFAMGERFVSASAAAAPSRRDRSVRAAVRHRRRAAQGIRVLRRIVAHPGFARNALYAVLGVPLGSRCVGRRADRHGNRDSS